MSSQTRNSGMLPDSWRGHSVRVPTQVQNLPDTSGEMLELLTSYHFASSAIVFSTPLTTRAQRS